MGLGMGSSSWRVPRSARGLAQFRFNLPDLSRFQKMERGANKKLLRSVRVLSSARQQQPGVPGGHGRAWTIDFSSPDLVE